MKNEREGRQRRTRRICAQCGKMERFTYDDTTIGDECRKANIASRIKANKRLPYYLADDTWCLWQRDNWYIPQRLSGKVRRHA